MSRRLVHLLSSGVLPPILALAVFAPVLGHGLLWDDSVILEHQLPGLTVWKALAPPPGFYQWRYHYYRPLVLLSLMLDRAIYGTNPFGFHLTVWLLHAATAYAVFLLAKRLLEPSYATLAGALFAVFPLNTECVAWIAGRNDILAGLFGTLATAAFLKGVGFPARSSDAVSRGEKQPSRAESSTSPGGKNARTAAGGPRPAAGGESPGSIGMLALGSILLLAALLSKESAIALAPVLLVLAFLGHQGGPTNARLETTARTHNDRHDTDSWIHRLRAGMPAFTAVVVPIIVYGAMRVVLNPGARAEAIPGGGPPPVEAVLTTGGFFPLHLLAPFGAPYRSQPPSHVLIGVAAIALVILGCGLALWSFTRGRWAVFMALVWLASTCSVTAAAAAWNLTRTPVADRYLYMPAVGWCLLLATLIGALSSWLGGRDPAPSVGPWIGPALGGFLVAVYAILAVFRTPLYADELTFWSAATRAEPSSGAARMNLGNAQYAHGDSEGAMTSYRRALSLPLGVQDRTLALTDLGSVLYRKGRLDEAESTLREAASLAANGPTENFNLGALLYQKGLASQQRGDMEGTRRALEEARLYLERAVANDALHAQAWMLLGHCELYRGDVAAAKRCWTKVLEIDGPEGPVGREAAVALTRTGL